MSLKVYNVLKRKKEVFIPQEENKVKKIFSNLTELKQNYIYLRKTNGIYETSIVPFKEEEEKEENKSVKKENIIIHVNEDIVPEKKRGRKKKSETVKEEDE